MKELIKEYQKKLIDNIEALDVDAIESFARALKKTRDENKQVIIMGNGGSGATASHFAGDFNKGLSLGKEKRFRVISLVDNSPIVLSLANDVSYDDIFVEQVKNFFQEGDLVVAISGSGNSKNVLSAVEYAKNKGGVVVGLTGYDGGALKKLSDISLHANIDSMQIAEDIHMILMHMLYFILSEE